MLPASSVEAEVDIERGERVMSAFGPKQTYAVAPHMSAIGGKADMTVCRSPVSRSLLGGKADIAFCAAYVCF
jgi:hypothetical protein